MPLLPMSNLAASANDDLRITSKSKVLQLAKRNFDAAVFEIVVTIGNGANLQLMDEESTLSAPKFGQFVMTHSVSNLVITPSHASHLFSSGIDADSQLDTIMLVGESCISMLLG